MKKVFETLYAMMIGYGMTFVIIQLMYGLIMGKF